MRKKSGVSKPPEGLFLFKSTFLMFVPSLSWQMLSHLLYREEPRHTHKKHIRPCFGLPVRSMQGVLAAVGCMQPARASGDGERPRCEKTPASFSYHSHDHLAKTGSGQTWGKHSQKRRGVFLQRLSHREASGWRRASLRSSRQV